MTSDSLPLAEKKLNVTRHSSGSAEGLSKGKVVISCPRTLSSSTASTVASRQRQPPSPSKRSQSRRLSRSRSRSRLAVPHKASPTQTLTLTSAIAISTQAKDIEDVDINTISFPSPPSSRVRSASIGRHLPPRPASPTPPRRTSIRSPPPPFSVGRGRGSLVQSNPRTSPSVNNPRIRASTSPPTAGTPSTQKRARLNSLGQSPVIDVVEMAASMPERPGSPTPGSGPSLGPRIGRPAAVTVHKPTPLRPILPTDNNAKRVWKAVSTSPKLVPTALPPLDDDDDDIIVFRMDVDEMKVAPRFSVPSPVLRVEVDVGMTDLSSSSLEEQFADAVLKLVDPMILVDPRHDMQRQSLQLAKKVRRKMHPSISDDIPPPTPSPARLRQAIATMFLEHGNSFPQMRGRSPPGLGKGRRGSLLRAELYLEGPSGA